MDYYRVLGVAKSASSSEIKLAFRALALKLHPDIAKSDKTESLHAFQRVSTAYETLSNKTKKELYDYEIGNIQNGANIVGGCCRITHNDIEKLVKKVHGGASM